MLGFAALALCTLAVHTVSGQDSSAELAKGRQLEICRKFPLLRICSLQAELDGVLDEAVVALVRGVESGESAEDGRMFNRLQKRKSAFVRFGKRSSDMMAEVLPEEQLLRAPVGMFLNTRPTRKSSYIRFG